MLARTLLRSHVRPVGLSAQALAPARTFSTSPRYLKPAVETISSSTPSPPPPTMKAGKGEGTIASVFATLSGGTLEDALPDRFADLKRSLVTSPSHAEHLQTTWRSVLSALSARVAETERLGGDSIPEVTFPSTSDVGPLQSWTDASTYEAIQQRGVAVIRNVIPSEQVLAWKEDIKAYAARNNAKGFPDDNPQVYELYWTPAQQAARTHPNLLTTSERFLQLFHQPASNSALGVDTTAVLGQPLNYCDRLRIRQPGDAKFALGAHIDGGGVERWECDNFRGLWSSILQEKGDWTKHDPWSLGANGERMTAKTDMYDGPGQCAVFRPLQGWLSMSTTRAGEGTLKVLPFLRESTAYIVLRPFFQPLIPRAQCSTEAQFLHADNWVLDTTSRRFPGCSLGHNIELSSTTHPHLALDKTMISIPHVNPGDMVLWHCDAVHSVENTHRGKSDSSVLYIPAIPTTKVNWSYIMNQRQCFERGVPPPDFPGGKGESDAHGRAIPDQVAGQKARTSLGLAKFNLDAATSAPERALLEWCNSQL